VINFPFTEKFGGENSFEVVNFKSLRFYRAPVELSRKLIVPKIKSFLDRMKITKEEPSSIQIPGGRSPSL
jgi:hypothetical protein